MHAGRLAASGGDVRLESRGGGKAGVRVSEKDVEQGGNPSRHGESTADGVASKGKGKQGPKTKSSLHRAVMEKLEVQKAMSDLAGSTPG